MSYLRRANMNQITIIIRRKMTWISIEWLLLSANDQQAAMANKVICSFNVLLIDIVFDTFIIHTIYMINGILPLRARCRLATKQVRTSSHIRTHIDTQHILERAQKENHFLLPVMNIKKIQIVRNYLWCPIDEWSCGECGRFGIGIEYYTSRTDFTLVFCFHRAHILFFCHHFRVSVYLFILVFYIFFTFVRDREAGERSMNCSNTKTACEHMICVWSEYRRGVTGRLCGTYESTERLHHAYFFFF